MNEYLSLALISAVVSLVIGIVLFRKFIPLLRKVKLGQKILEIGPSWHKCKEGTPNLGGLFFIIATVVAFIIGSCLILKLSPKDVSTSGEVGTYWISALSLFGLALSQGFIGFVDDYVKLFKKRNKGLSASQKLVLQFVTVALYLFVNAYFLGYDTIINLPFIGDVDFGVFYYVILLLAIVYIVNCANLTDGIDGLAGSIALIICVTFLIYGINFAKPLMSVANAALCGGLLAFLIFNFHPAKLFMGDTGSMVLGGFIDGTVMLTNNEFLLIPVSCIWIIEGLSVVLQVISFKTTGKRIFKMSPIHHHFEKCSWSEVKIVGVFSAITVAFCVLTYYLLIN